MIFKQEGVGRCQVLPGSSSLVPPAALSLTLLLEPHQTRNLVIIKKQRKKNTEQVFKVTVHNIKCISFTQPFLLNAFELILSLLTSSGARVSAVGPSQGKVGPLINLT